MSKSTMNISQIEDFFHSLLYGKLTENLFFTSLPTTIKEGWDSMVLVDIPRVVDNFIGKGTVAVYCYAEPLLNGTKNVKVLSDMNKKLIEIIDNSKDDTYLISRDEMYPEYDTERNLHCNVTLINIYIV